MIPPRLHEILVRICISDYTIDRGPKAGKRIVTMDRGRLHTANYRATDLLKLEKKGLITFSKLEEMSAMWGCPWFEVIVTGAGKEEIADEYARRCAEADAANALLETIVPEVDDVDDQRVGASERADARARQRAAKVRG